MFQGMRYVYAVYQEMSFSRAAKKMFLSQPNLSNSVRKVEERLGFPIFDRDTSPIRLTEPGKEYIKAVEAILAVENGFESYLSDLGELKTGSLTIGGTNFFISYVLPPLLSSFTDRYPAIRVELVEGTTAELTEKLKAGALDLLVDNALLDPAAYGRRTLQEEHLLLAVPCRFSSAYATKAYSLNASAVKAGRHLDDGFEPAPMEYFKDDPFLLLREGNDTRERAINICRAHHFVPRIKLELEQQITAYNLSCQGMGVSFLGDSLIRSVPGAQDLLFYKLGHPDAVRQVSLYYKKNRYLSRAATAFLDQVEDE